MIKSSCGKHKFYTKSIEICFKHSVYYLRITSQPTKLSSKAISDLKSVKYWFLDGINATLKSKLVTLNSASCLIINVLIPWNAPVPVTIGATPEIVPDEEVVSCTVEVPLESMEEVEPPPESD